MRKLFSVMLLSAFAALSAPAEKRDPIDAAIEKTKTPKVETLADAIRYEKMKDAAAERQARLDGEKAAPRSQAKKPETVASARK